MIAFLRRCAALLWCLVPIGVFGMVWAPQLAHFYVSGIALPPESMERARVNPPEPVLRELGAMGLGVPTGFRNQAEVVATAERMLRGELALPGASPSRFALPFDPVDLTSVSAPLQYASLVVPETLLAAYEFTGREEFFKAALDATIAFAGYERSAWKPVGFLWNDHAIAARVPVLTRMWRHYRGRPDFDPTVAGIILQFLERSGQLLARPSHFTFRTNHGVMQNVALLHLCVAYPFIAAGRGWCDFAIARLDAQLGFYINDEGVVLEHSAGYHAMGLELMAMALRYLTLLELAPPAGWAEKYRKARAYYAQLRRPDGTLPLYGDTRSEAEHILLAALEEGGRMPALKPVDETRPAPFGLYTAAGHAVWWRGLDGWPAGSGLTQTVVTWANFPSGAHKLADDMGVLLWRDGRNWLTHTGYWPYGRWGRIQAEGWDSANAPHLAGEPQRSARRVELLAYSGGPGLTAVDLRRHGPDGYSARRQVVQAGPDLWMVLDEVQDDADRVTVTRWTVDPSLVVQRTGGRNAYRLVAPGGAFAMRVVFLASPQGEPRIVSGSRQPFAGWVVIDREPRPATAFTIEQPSRKSWALSLWMAERDASQSPAPEMEWNGAENWTLKVAGRDGTLILQRAGRNLRLDSPGSGRDTVQETLIAGPDVVAQRTATISAFEAGAAQFRRKPDLHGYRVRITYILLAVLAAQETVLLLLRRKLRRRRLIRGMLGAVWLAGGAWIALAYLAA